MSVSLIMSSVPVFADSAIGIVVVLALTSIADADLVKAARS
jgi:type III secretory pathway component EscS